jgi:hypothetical protein
MDTTTSSLSRDGVEAISCSPPKHVDANNQSPIIVNEEETRKTEDAQVAECLARNSEDNNKQPENDDEQQLEREIASVRRIRDCVDGVRAALASADEQIRGVAMACAEAEVSSISVKALS